MSVKRYKKPYRLVSPLWKPHDYQKVGVNFLVDHPCAGLFMDPGLGKTTINLTAFAMLKELGRVGVNFVFAPLRVVYETWPQEVEKWEFPLEYRILHGSKKMEALEEKAPLYFINYEGLPWLYETMLARPSLFKEMGVRMLTLDESSKIKHSKTQRFKMLKPLLPTFARRVAMTGTPASNGLENLWAQLYALDLGQSLGKYITHYRNEYFRRSGYMGYEWELIPGADERIYKAISPLVLRLNRSVLKLPPIKNIYLHVEIPETARKAYTEMEREALTVLRRRTITAANAGVATGKCRQFANGNVYDSDHSVVRVHRAKLERLVDLVDELAGQPLLVCYEFEHDVAQFMEEFGKNIPIIGCGAKKDAVSRAITLWNAGKLPLLFVNASAAYGLNLQAGGCNLCWFALTWNLEHYEQLYQRLWRQGQRNTVMNYHLVATNTVDEVMVNALRAKDHTQQALLKALETYSTERKAK